MLARGLTFQLFSTLLAISLRMASVSRTAFKASYRREWEWEESRRSARVSDVSLESDAMAAVSGEEEMVWRVCERGEVGCRK